MPEVLSDTYSHMTGARQTMTTWAKVIDSFESLPEIYKAPYQSLKRNIEVFPFTVLVPPQIGHWKRKSIERLLCEIDHTFFILEREGSQVVTTGYKYQDICRLELGNILLYSWFSINGRTTTGNDVSLKVEFNEASLRHFEPFFQKMRPKPVDPDPTAVLMEQSKFEYLITENYKYLNFARHSLVPGEQVFQSVYQPQINQRIMSVLGRNFNRAITLAHLTILTDREIILIGDAEGISEKKRSKYGGIQCYFPLRSLVSVTIEEEPGDLLRLTYHLSPDEQITRLFDASHQEEIENLKKSIENLIG